MKHEDWLILVSAYNDGELSSEEQARVEAHLAGCSECAAALQAYRRLGHTIRKLPRGVPSRNLWPRVQEGLASRRTRPLWWKLLPVASALAVLVIAVSLFIGLNPLWKGQTSVGAPERSMVELPPAQKITGTAAPEAAPRPAAETDGALQLAPTEAALGIAAVSPPVYPTKTLALEVDDMAVQTLDDLTVPRIRGVLYDAQGRPLTGTVLMVSGPHDWYGYAVTGPDGSFLCDLPGKGTYRLAVAPPALTVELDTGKREPGERLYATPSAGSEFWGDFEDLFTGWAWPIVLGPHDEAILLLQAH